MFALYPIHKSIGILSFSVIVIRIYWSFVNGWLQLADNYTKIEYNLSKIVHWMLIIITIVMLISGFIMSGAVGHGVSVFGLEIVAANFDPVAKN